MRRRWLVILAVSLAFPVTASASAAVVATERSATTISALGGMAVWSSLDYRIDGYRLRMYANGIVRTLPVRPEPEPFDAELGVDSHRHIVIVYSRCRKQRGLRAQSSGCDIYEFRVGGHEVRVAGPSSKNASEFEPTLDGDRIAFARVADRSVEPASRLYIYDLRSRKTHAIPGGPRGFFESVGTDQWVGGPGPTRLSLVGKHLVYEWQYVDNSCEAPDGGWVTVSQVSLVNVNGGAPALIAGSTCAEGADSLKSPVLTSRSIIYLDSRSGPQQLARYTLETNQTSHADGYGGTVAVDGNDTKTFDVRAVGELGEFDVEWMNPVFGG